MDKKTTSKLGELYCGPGGIGLAAKQAKLITNNEIYTISHAWPPIMVKIHAIPLRTIYAQIIQILLYVKTYEN